MGLDLRLIRRLALAAAGAGALVGLASLGMLVTTEAPALSMLIEPLSLLFLPGIAVALAWGSVLGYLNHHLKAIGDSHDFSLAFVVWCTFASYFVVLLRLLTRRRSHAALTSNLASR